MRYLVHLPKQLLLRLVVILKGKCKVLRDCQSDELAIRIL